MPREMGLLSWSFEGLGNPCTFRDLDYMVKEMKPRVLFFIETKIQTTSVEKLKYTLDFDSIFCIDGLGKGSGLGLLSKTEFSLEI